MSSSTPRLGAVHVRWLDDALEATNPGGFPEGASPRSLLVTTPRPRNALLADAVKRIGLVERTGRGVDIVYQGSPRFGRPPPDYSRSGPDTVVVRLTDGPADQRFPGLVVAEETRTGAPMSVDSLLALRELRERGSVDPAGLAPVIQRGEAEAERVLEQRGEAKVATKRGQSFHLSADSARRLGRPAAPGRGRAESPTEQEEAVLEFVAAHERITRREAAELVRLGPHQTTRLLDRLVERGRLTALGRAAGYVVLAPASEGDEADELNEVVAREARLRLVDG